MNDKKVWWVCVICQELNRSQLASRQFVCKTCGGVFDRDEIESLTHITLSPQQFGIVYARAVRTGDQETMNKVTDHAMKSPELAWIVTELDEMLVEYASQTRT
jgi:hypothetical protein